MIKDKLESLKRALKYSYQAAKVIKLGENSEQKALINPNRLKLDYDDKMISIDFASGFKPGDVFEWKNTAVFNLT